MNRSFKITSLISSLILVVVAGFVYINAEKLKSSADIQLPGGTIIKTGKIYGYVLNENDQQIQASLLLVQTDSKNSSKQIPGTERFAETNTEGKYSYDNIVTGNYLITAAPKTAGGYSCYGYSSHLLLMPKIGDSSNWNYQYDIEPELMKKAKFSGTVTNSKTGEIVREAQISASLTPSNYTNIGGTGLTGNYESKCTYDVDKSYYLKAEATGFQEFTTTITTKAGTNSVNFSLSPQMNGGSSSLNNN